MKKSLLIILVFFLYYGCFSSKDSEKSHNLLLFSLKNNSINSSESTTDTVTKSIVVEPKYSKILYYKVLENDLSVSVNNSFSFNVEEKSSKLKSFSEEPPKLEKGKTYEVYLGKTGSYFVTEIKSEDGKRSTAKSKISLEELLKTQKDISGLKKLKVLTESLSKDKEASVLELSKEKMQKLEKARKSSKLKESDSEKTSELSKILLEIGLLDKKSLDRIDKSIKKETSSDKTGSNSEKKETSSGKTGSNSEKKETSSGKTGSNSEKKETSSDKTGSNSFDYLSYGIDVLQENDFFIEDQNNYYEDNNSIRMYVGKNGGYGWKFSRYNDRADISYEWNTRKRLISIVDNWKDQKVRLTQEVSPIYCSGDNKYYFRVSLLDEEKRVVKVFDDKGIITLEKKCNTPVSDWWELYDYSFTISDAIKYILVEDGGKSEQDGSWRDYGIKTVGLSLLNESGSVLKKAGKFLSKRSKSYDYHSINVLKEGDTFTVDGNDYYEDSNSIKMYVGLNGGSGWSFHSEKDDSVTSYGWNTRRRLISVVDSWKNELVRLSQDFTYVYCGGDRYYFRVSLLDAEKKVVKVFDNKGISSLEGDCMWKTNWKTYSYDFTISDEIEYVVVEDGGKSSEYWSGQYGTNMKDLQLLNVDGEVLLKAGAFKKVDKDLLRVDNDLLRIGDIVSPKDFVAVDNDDIFVSFKNPRDIIYGVELAIFGKILKMEYLILPMNGERGEGWEKLTKTILTKV